MNEEIRKDDESFKSSKPETTTTSLKGKLPNLAHLSDEERKDFVKEVTNHCIKLLVEANLAAGTLGGFKAEILEPFKGIKFEINFVASKL